MQITFAKLSRSVTTLLLSTLLIFGLVAKASEPQLISSDDALYPRLVQLNHQADPENNGDIIASVTSFAGGQGHADIFVSRNEGESFERLSQIYDEDFLTGLCCGGLYELPSAVNELAAGTLLWAGSVGQEAADTPMQMKIYHSVDQGQSWDYLSNCVDAQAPKRQGGIWEAEFVIAKTGELVCYFADETPQNHSQTLRYTKSSDGINWSDPVNVVASTNPNDRPGMPEVVRLASGQFMMSYEICGGLNCATYYRLSEDGLDWGDPTDLGRAVETPDGLTFWATPTLALAPKASGGEQLLLQGHTLVKGGADQPGNGATVFINSSADPVNGEWYAYDAPTPVDLPAGTSVNYCENYSSPLLPLSGGLKLLQLSSDFADDGVCRTWFNVAPLGGVRAQVDEVRGSAGETLTGTVHLRVSDGFDGDYTLDLQVEGLEGRVELSQSPVTLLSDREQSVSFTVIPEALVQSLSPADITLMAGALLVPWFCSMLLVRSGRIKLAVCATLATVVLMLSSCGGGGGGNAAPGGSVNTVTTHYQGVLRVSSVDNPNVETQTQFTVVVSRQE